MKRLGNNSQKGAVLVFFALLLPIIVFFAGMAIDFGRAYLHKAHLQNAADAAALAGVSAAAESGRARLVDDIPSDVTAVDDSDRLSRAQGAANVVLAKDTGKAGANAENTILRAGKEGTDETEEKDTYYYMVELTDEVKMVFAQFFLPERFLPNDWNVKVAAKAWAKARVGDGESLGGPDLLTQMKKAADENTASEFYAFEKEVSKLAKAQGLTLTKDELRARTQMLSFTNDGVAYDKDGNRSEVFNMDAANADRNNMKDFFINLKQDVWYPNPLTTDFDVTYLQGMSYEQARALFYSNDKKFINVVLPDGTLLKGPMTWDALIRAFGKQIGNKNSKTWDDLTNNRLTWDQISEAERKIVWNALTSSIAATINVNSAYQKRDVDALSDDLVSLTTKGERNKQDPLFIRIESEEFNVSGVTNTVHDVTINIKADNMADNYRPLFFVYEGPIDVNGERGTDRASHIVTLNLETDFKGCVYAPNSPVCIKVTGDDIDFRGIIVAAYLVDENGNRIHMDDEVTKENAQVFQDFARDTLHLKSAKFDGFGVVKLNVYKPKNDIFYTKDRAHITI